MINNKQTINTNNPDGKAKLLMFCAFFLCLLLFLWIGYSFWGFYKDWKSVPENVDTNSYIDKTGLSQVKSILEGRK